FDDGGSTLGAADRLVEEARRILTLLDKVAPDGLVIDIRGNPGGQISAAERMLQMLTPNRIEPELFHLANTPALVKALRRLKAVDAKGHNTAAEIQMLNELRPWLGD